MILTRRFPFKFVLLFGAVVAAYTVPWAVLVYVLYAYAGLEFLRVPFLPIATVGTAVAFYVGFKNNSAYERFWEGRKIWGGIVNTSRVWATAVLSYVDPADVSESATATRKRLVYRQLAWINALRLQLRKTSRFFHKPAKSTKRRLDRHADAMRNDWDREVGPFLDADEHTETTKFANPATHLLKQQGADLAELVRSKRLDMFHQISLMEQVTELYALQGQCERIKNTPFPRQYAEYSRIFVRVFNLLVPLGLIDVFADNVALAQGALATAVPGIPVVLSSLLVSWVFWTMEGIGDSSEDPFERSMNDVPMNALCRTIEIDLRQMLGESKLPAREEPIDDILY